jgi:hypothetical protein
MKFSRPSRSITVLIMLGGMLFAQLAVAGYVCPSLGMAPSGGAAAMVMDDDQAISMTGCESRDKAQPNLCQAQDQSNNQSLDKPVTPHVFPFLPAALTLVFRNIKVLGDSSTIEPSGSLLLARSTAPPLSIRNCCFRI